MRSVKIIAEGGINHNGDLRLAKRLVDLAQLSGCDYIKFQKRTPELCVPEEQKHVERQTPWGVMTYLEYKKRIEISEELWYLLQDYSLGRIQLFASVWDLESARFMKGLSNKLVKIPSALLTDEKLLEYCLSSFDKVIVSTGMSTEDEVEKVVQRLRVTDVVMHTCSAYPAKVEDLNLAYLLYLRKKWHCDVGYSGHEFGLATTFAAVGLGALWVERHITVDRTLWGSDQLSSVEPSGLFKLVKGIRDIEKASGTFGPRTILSCEEKKRGELRGIQ